MAKSKSKPELAELPTAAAAGANDAAPLPLWKAWGPYGHGEHTVAAADEEAARAEYRRLDGLLASEQLIQVQRVEG